MRTPFRKFVTAPVNSLSGLGKPLVSTTAGIIVRAASDLGNLVDPNRPRTYAAFISYSHRDIRIARWLHRAIETYRIPRDVVADNGAKVPVRVRPVFRDEDELGGASELGPKIEAALATSQALIVVCSPAAAQSVWVDTEIRTFKRLNPDGLVLAMIAHGVPGSADAECFPPALLCHVTPSGELDQTRPVEPLAPDLQKLDRRQVKLKLIAGLIAVPYSALARRDRRRVRMIAAGLSTVAAVLIAVLASLSVIAITYARIAVHERNDAIAARDLAERRTWLAQEAAAQIRNGDDQVKCAAK